MMQYYFSEMNTAPDKMSSNSYTNRNVLKVYGKYWVFKANGIFIVKPKVNFQGLLECNITSSEKIPGKV